MDQSIVFQNIEVMKFVYAELSAIHFDTWSSKYPKYWSSNPKRASGWKTEFVIRVVRIFIFDEMLKTRARTD